MPHFSGNRYTLQAATGFANLYRHPEAYLATREAQGWRIGFPWKRGITQMSDAVLTIEQTLKLLLELATNDGFRLRYEEKPAAALLELGIPAATVANLNAACLAPARLASKTKFKQAHDDLSNAKAAVAQSMVIPNLRLDYGRSKRR